MSQRKTVIKVSVFVALLGGLTIYSAHSPAERSISDIVKPTDVSSIPASELEKWLRADCRFRGNRPLYEACARTIASRLPAFDNARSDHFGEKYSPNKYLECRLKSHVADVGCDRYALVRKENPIYWPNPKVAMPKLPDAPKESVYRPWMTKKQYFEALCKAEAGEFIYKTVDNVEGIYQIRPRASEKDDLRQEDRYVLEDPYGYYDWETDGPHREFAGPNGYRVFETPDTQTWFASPSPRLLRYTRVRTSDTTKWEIVKSDLLTTQYGVLWRGIQRTGDRENNIGGGEFVIINVQAGETLAVKRGFRLGGPIQKSHTEIYWPSGRLCVGDKAGLFRMLDFTVKVLRPAA